MSTTVHFATNSATMDVEDLEKLNKIANRMRSMIGSAAIVEGHADSTGPLKFNIKLSRRRAESVKQQLIKRGISSKRLSVVSYGPSRPAATNATKAGRKKNRRAVIKVTKPTQPK